MMKRKGRRYHVSQSIFLKSSNADIDFKGPYNFRKICLWNADSFDTSMYSNVASDSITNDKVCFQFKFLTVFLRTQVRL